MFKHICPTCKIIFEHEWQKRKFCSRDCFKKSPSLIKKGKELGQQNKGKRVNRKPTKKRPLFYINKDRYRLIKKNGHPTAQKSGYIMEHRYVMEKILGRILEPQERVHHINRIRDDNRPENLRLFPNHSEHIKNCAKWKDNGQFIRC